MLMGERSLTGECPIQVQIRISGGESTFFDRFLHFQNEASNRKRYFFFIRKRGVHLFGLRFRERSFHQHVWFRIALEKTSPFEFEIAAKNIESKRELVNPGPAPRPGNPEKLVNPGSPARLPGKVVEKR